MISNEIPVNLTDNETSLIKLAIKDWNNPNAFNDEQVAQVKDIFTKVFHVEADKMGGLCFPDGMVMQPRNTEKAEYYAILWDTEDKCKGLHVECEMIGIQQFRGNTTPFSLYMMFMADSERHHMAREDEEETYASE